MNAHAPATVRGPRALDDAWLSSLADSSTDDDIQGLETRLAGLPELERKQFIDKVIRTRQARARRLADAALRGGKPGGH